MAEGKHDDGASKWTGWLRAGVVIALVSTILASLWLLPELAFNLGVAGVALLVARELYLLEEFGRCHPLYRRLGLAGVAVSAVQMMAFPGMTGITLPLLVVGIFGVSILNTRSPNEAEFHGLLHVTFGLVYAGGLFAQLILIRSAPAGRGLTTVLVVTVLAREVGANLGGVLFPRGKLLNGSINPKKSYQGAAVGIAAAVFAAVLLSQRLEIRFTASRGVVFGVCVGIACQLGDLSESYMKRAAGRRHSGGLLGPEGGILDFVDAAVFATGVTRVLMFVWGY